MKIIIFSKNRAMQLEALLRSLPKNSDVLIIYRATDSFYKNGYDHLINYINFGDYQFFCQKNIASLHEMVKQIFLYQNNQDYTTFMVDDNIIYDSNFPEINLKQNQCYSLRLHSGIKNQVHFNYTMSLDGNIFRTKDIDYLVNSLNFDNPNQFESALQGQFGAKFKMIYGRGYLIGFNHNRVSDASHCHFTGDFSEHKLNQMFLDGFLIDYETMDIKPINNVHSSQKYLFKKANNR